MKFLQKEIKDIKPGDLLVEKFGDVAAYVYIIISNVTTDNSRFVLTYYGFNHNERVSKIQRCKIVWGRRFVAMAE